MTHLLKNDSISFEKEKTLYHYTSLNTAFEHIFLHHKLRLSPITSAIDPMEHLPPKTTYSIYGSEEDCERIKQNHNGFDIAKKVKNHYQSLRQLCLSRNNPVDFEGEYTGAFEPIDHFGFAKPRMWDQYGGKYTGVCIALNRNKLISEFPESFNLIDIKYSKNLFLKPNIDTSGVDLNIVDKIGEDEYLKQKHQCELNKLKTKHIDYKNETETKIITSSQNMYEYIQIYNCIQAIFITNKFSYAYRSMLKGIANNYKVRLFELSIDRTGLEVREIK